MAILEAHGIVLRYGAAVPVVVDFDLSLRLGEIVTILGPSGVGKSSLLRTLAGLQPPIAGSIQVDGTAVNSVHPRVALAFQNPCLLPWLDLEHNIAFGLNFRRQPRLASATRRTRIDASIRRVGLEDARRLFPQQLSGGMAQRAALARCLARDPRVLLLDEPFGALDEVTRTDMQNLLQEVVQELSVATVLVTHHIDEALLLSDRVLLLGGRPARQVAKWHIELPRPRYDRVAELGMLRIEIVQAMHRAMKSLH